MKTGPAEEMPAHGDDCVGRDVQTDVAFEGRVLLVLVVIAGRRGSWLGRFRFFFFHNRTQFAPRSGFECWCVGVDDRLVLLGRVVHRSEF